MEEAGTDQVDCLIDAEGLAERRTGLLDAMRGRTARIVQAQAGTSVASDCGSGDTGENLDTLVRELGRMLEDGSLRLASRTISYPSREGIDGGWKTVLPMNLNEMYAELRALLYRVEARFTTYA